MISDEIMTMIVIANNHYHATKYILGYEACGEVDFKRFRSQPYRLNSFLAFRIVFDATMEMKTLKSAPFAMRTDSVGGLVTFGTLIAYVCSNCEQLCPVPMLEAEVIYMCISIPAASCRSKRESMTAPHDVSSCTRWSELVLYTSIEHRSVSDMCTPRLHALSTSVLQRFETCTL